jgi:hypothetical protein
MSSDPDEKINTRGRTIIQECNEYNLCILNGTSLETASPGRFTSWQTAGQSVIDYAIVSETLLPLVHKLHVELPTEDEDDDWSDHMRICLTLDAKAFEYEPILPADHSKIPDFGGSNYIDHLYQETMDAKETKDEALESLWGQVLCNSPPAYIYVEGVAAKGNNKTGSSGAGIFFGLGSPSNRALRVPGPGRLSADRARLFAIHEALRLSHSDKSLVIFCTSKMIIRQLCYYAAKNTALGWPGCKWRSVQVHSQNDGFTTR